MSLTPPRQAQGHSGTSKETGTSRPPRSVPRKSRWHREIRGCPPALAGAERARGPCVTEMSWPPGAVGGHQPPGSHRPHLHAASCQVFIHEDSAEPRVGEDRGHMPRGVPPPGSPNSYYLHAWGSLGVCEPVLDKKPETQAVSGREGGQSPLPGPPDTGQRPAAARVASFSSRGSQGCSRWQEVHVGRAFESGEQPAQTPRGGGAAHMPGTAKARVTGPGRLGEAAGQGCGAGAHEAPRLWGCFLSSPCHFPQQRHSLHPPPGQATGPCPD